MNRFRKFPVVFFVTNIKSGRIAHQKFSISFFLDDACYWFASYRVIKAYDTFVMKLQYHHQAGMISLFKEDTA